MPGSTGERIISTLPMVLTGWLAILLVWAPLPFGSVTIFWSTLLRLGAFAALALALLVEDARRQRQPLLRIALAGCLVAILGLVQSVSLPDAIVGIVSPSHASQVETTRLLVADDGVDVQASLSVDPAASRRAALGWLAMVAAFLAAAVVGRRRSQRRVLYGAVVVTAVLQVFFGARGLFAASTQIWRVAVPGDPTRLRGSFVNPDHLALFLEIALVVTFAWGYRSLRRAAKERSPEWKVIGVAAPTICWLLLFVGIAFTGSRAGLIAAVLATLAQGLLLAAAFKSWRLAPVGVVAGTLGVAAVAWIGMQQGLGRLLATSAYEVAWNARPVLYQASLELWKLFPVLGTGLGTFAAAFPIVQPEEVAGLVWNHAHNDWLEMLVTTGILGLGLLLVGIWLLLDALRRLLLGSRSSDSRSAALAGLGAVIVVAFHEAVDFGLTMPANAFTLAVVLGASLGALRDYRAAGAAPLRAMTPGVKGRRSAERSSRREGRRSTSTSTSSGSPGRVTKTP